MALAAGRVVMQRLEAFRRDDFDAAFDFASAGIHELFDRARFEVMLRGGYPEIARSASAVIDGSECGAGGRLHVLVRVRGANGRWIEAVYEMVREDRAGGSMASWRVPTAAKRREPQNNPTTLPSASTSIVSAPGVLGSPGIVRMSPAYATTKPAPAASLASRTLTVKPRGRPSFRGSSESELCVLAMHTGSRP